MKSLIEYASEIVEAHWNRPEIIHKGERNRLNEWAFIEALYDAKIIDKAEFNRLMEKLWDMK